jgi:hypothetical protein
MQRFTYQYKKDGKDSITFDYSPEADERLFTTIDSGTPFLYLNRSGMLTLAKILIKIAEGEYSKGFHVHLSRDFNADNPEVLVVMLSESNREG